MKIPLRVLSLSVVPPVLEPSAVGVPVRVGHVPDAVPLPVDVLAEVAVAVGPVVLALAVEKAVADLTRVTTNREGELILVESYPPSPLPLNYRLTMPRSSRTWFRFPRGSR